MNILTAKKLKWLKKGTVQEKLSKYFPIFTICGTFRAKNPLAKHDHCIYYAQLFWSVSCIFMSPMGTKGEISKCMLNVCLDILMAFLIWMYSSILRCSHLKVIRMDLFILHGCLDVFSFERYFQNESRGPQPPFYFEPLLCWATCYLTPPHQWFFGEKLRKINYLGQGSPQLIS